MLDSFFAVSLAVPEVLLGLSRSLRENPFSIVLVLAGLAGVALGVTALAQTRRWPRAAPQRRTPTQHPTPATTLPLAADPAEPLPVQAPPPRSDTQGLRIEFPAIQPRHPDVWAPGTPLDVRVGVHAGIVPPGAAAVGVRLVLLNEGREDEIGHVGPDAHGTARFTLVRSTRGEVHVIARLVVDGTDTAQAVRALRLMPYRDEIVETFEDFVKWASSHFDPMDRRMTAREFVDRFADAVPAARNPPLDRIADIYELANYSDHDVDRALYLDFVEAFLELEDAGALEGPGREAR